MILYGTDPAGGGVCPGDQTLWIEEILVSSGFPTNFSREASIPISAHSPERRASITRKREAMIRWISGNRISQGKKLADYIAADGKITVRYTGGSDAENGISQDTSTPDGDREGGKTDV